jgi:hypothetical protein
MNNSTNLEEITLIPLSKDSTPYFSFHHLEQLQKLVIQGYTEEGAEEQIRAEEDRWKRPFAQSDRPKRGRQKAGLDSDLFGDLKLIDTEANL